ncbi:MAG: hypothetical protein AAGJ93_17115 [Bacteroidota bacterium]
MADTRPYTNYVLSNTQKYNSQLIYHGKALLTNLPLDILKYHEVSKALKAWYSRIYFFVSWCLSGKKQNCLVMWLTNVA